MAGPSYSPGPGFGAFVNSLANPPNPMEQLGKTVNALTAVKNFQAQKAMADIYSQAIDPTTGQVDQGKLNSLIGANPAAAWNAGPAMQQAGQAVGAEGSGTSANVKANLDQLSAAGTLMLPLYKQAIATNYVSPADAQAALDQAYQMKLVTPQQYQAYSSTLKSTQNAASFVIGANTGIESARTLALGKPGALDVGPGYQPVQPVPGALPSAVPPLQKGLAPEAQIGTTDVPIGGGQTAHVPNWVIAAGPAAIEQWLTKTNPNYVPGSAQPPPASGPGRYPQTPAAPAPPGPGAPAEPPGPGSASKPLWLQPPPRGTAPAEAGGPGVSPTPQYGAGVAGTTQKASDAAGSLGTQAGETQNTIATLNDMERTLNQPGVTTGVGAQSVTGFRQLLMNAGIVPKDSAAPDLSTAQGAQEEFNKDSALLQKLQLGTIGNPTDARQDLVAEATPGSALSKTGNLGIIRMLRGNQQAINVMNSAWNQARQSAGWTAGGSEANNFNAWRTQFLAPDKATDGGKFDSRVFWIANAPTIADQRTYAATIPKDQQPQFLKNLAYATNMGWVNKGADGSVQLQGQ